MMELLSVNHEQDGEMHCYGEELYVGMNYTIQ